MTNYYSTINEVVLTFSNISRNKDGFASIVARFERPNATGFDFRSGSFRALRIPRPLAFQRMIL